VTEESNGRLESIYSAFRPRFKPAACRTQARNFAAWASVLSVGLKLAPGYHGYIICDIQHRRALFGVRMQWLTVNSSVFRDIMPCTLLNVTRRFRGARIHLQGRRISQAVYQRESTCQTYVGGSFLRPWKWRRHIPEKHRFTSTGLQDVIALKLELLETTSMRTSNPTRLTVFHPWILSCICYFNWVSEVNVVTNGLYVDL
jgi:hypothetical protein